MISSLEISRRCWVAIFLIFVSGPTRTGRMMPASALSTAPRSDVSSHGCTTMVGTGGTAFAAAIKRSYLVGGRASLPSAGMTFIVLLRILLTGVTTPPVGSDAPFAKGLFDLGQWNGSTSLRQSKTNASETSTVRLRSEAQCISEASFAEG